MKLPAAYWDALIARMDARQMVYTPPRHSKSVLMRPIQQMNARLDFPPPRRKPLFVAIHYALAP